MENVNEKFGPIRKGLLEYAVLQIISRREVYAADILAKLGSTEFATQEGTLYPLLSKMRREGWVDYDWKESEAGPPRKYYRLTVKGRTQLNDISSYWRRLNDVITKLGE